MLMKCARAPVHMQLRHPNWGVSFIKFALSIDLSLTDGEYVPLRQDKGIAPNIPIRTACP